MKAIDVYNAVVSWSQVHTVAAAIIGGLVGGYILGKVF